MSEGCKADEEGLSAEVDGEQLFLKASKLRHWKVMIAETGIDEGLGTLTGKM